MSSKVNDAIAELNADLIAFEQTEHALSLDLKLDLAEVIIRAMNVKGWTPKQLADAIDKSDDYIVGLVHSELNLNLDEIGRLCHALGIRLKLVVTSSTNDHP